MKTHVLLLAFLAQSIFVLAQDQSKAPGQINTNGNTNTLQIRSQSSLHSRPLFVVNAGDRTLEIASTSIQSSNSFPFELEGIDPGMIDAITVLKDKDAVEKYGYKGSRGVIILELEDGAFEKLPTDLADRFVLKK